MIEIVNHVKYDFKIEHYIEEDRLLIKKICLWFFKQPRSNRFIVREEVYSYGKQKKTEKAEDHTFDSFDGALKKLLELREVYDVEEKE